MGVVANPLVVRIFINSNLEGRENGWSERWPIYETNWNIALGVALQMAQARQRVLSSNAYIQWACLGTVTPPYVEQSVIRDPLGPLPQWGPAAFDMQGILFDLCTSDGENAPRLFRAIDGTQIAAKRWVYADMPIPWAPPALPADLATAPKDLLWQNTLATFRQFAATQQPMSDGHHGSGAGYWVNAYSQIVYRQVRSRRVGEPWKRMSWETSNYNHSVGWSPCGCATTVLRRSYAIPCRFGVGWRLRHIHYYPCQPGATVLPFATPFYGWARSKENTDFSGVGESRKYQYYDWTTGVQYGLAPGITWDGTEEEFNGFAPLPVWGTGSTPIPLRASCDAPGISRPMGPGGIAFGGAGMAADVEIMYAMGGGRAGGSAATHRHSIELAQGGSRIGGAAITKRRTIEAANGGSYTGGSATTVRSSIEMSIGGANVGGSAVSVYSSPGGRALVYGNSFGSVSATINWVWPSGTGAGDFLAAFAACNDPAGLPSMPAGWTPGPSVVYPGQGMGQWFFYPAAPNQGSGPQATTFSGSPTRTSLAIADFSGVSSSAVDRTASATATFPPLSTGPLAVGPTASTSSATELWLLGVADVNNNGRVTSLTDPSWSLAFSGGSACIIYKFASSIAVATNRCNLQSQGANYDLVGSIVTLH